MARPFPRLVISVSTSKLSCLPMPSQQPQHDLACGSCRISRLRRNRDPLPGTATTGGHGTKRWHRTQKKKLGCAAQIRWPVAQRIGAATKHATKVPAAPLLEARLKRASPSPKHASPVGASAGRHVWVTRKTVSREGRLASFRPFPPRYWRSLAEYFTA